MGTRGSFPGSKAACAWSYHSPPSSAEVKEWVELYLHSPNTFSWRCAQLKNRDNSTFTFTTAFTPAVGPPSLLSIWYGGALSPGIKQSEPETNHSPPSTADVTNVWSYTSTPQYVLIAWFLVKHGDNVIQTSATVTVWFRIPKDLIFNHHHLPSRYRPTACYGSEV
jgi:hypothetical protein